MKWVKIARCAAVPMAFSLTMVARSLFAAEFDPALDVVPPQPVPSESVDPNDHGGTGDDRRADWQLPRAMFRWSIDNNMGEPVLVERLSGSRPTFTGASSTVGPVLQFESGYTYFYNNNDNVSVRTHSGMEGLWRGCLIANWLEFRLATNHITQRISSPTSLTEVTGAEDLYLGLMMGLTAQAVWLPETALITHMTAPTGKNGFSNDEVLPGIKLAYTWRLDEFISTGGSTQLNERIDNGTGRSYIEFAQSWMLRIQVCESVDTFAEWYAFSPHSADTAAVEHYLNVGVTVLCFRNFQMDFRYGQGLNRTADDYFFGVGFVWRMQRRETAVDPCD